MKIKINRHLFEETSHSPAVIDIVGEDMVGKVIDFCFIANPYYPTEDMMREMVEKIPSIIKSYPSSNPKLAQLSLAEVLHVNPDHIIIGNGATELITLIQHELVDDIAIPVPTFSEYLEKLRQTDNAKLYELSKDENYQLSLPYFASWIDDHQISSALIINPGNPTGQFIPTSEMLTFLKRMTHLRMILVDESFLDFSGIENASLMSYLEDFPNLMIVRSMSKHCGVPGLRLGYCCSSNPNFLVRIRQLLPVWNINTIAELFLTMLEKTDREYRVSVTKIVQDMNLLYRDLVKVSGFKVYPTGSNFIMLKVTCGLTAQEVQIKLLEDYGLYVRDCSNKVGLDQYHIRLASQGRENDKILINALKELSK